MPKQKFSLAQNETLLPRKDNKSYFPTISKLTKFFNKRLIEINSPSNLGLLKLFPDQKEIWMNDI